MFQENAAGGRLSRLFFVGLRSCGAVLLVVGLFGPLVAPLFAMVSAWNSPVLAEGDRWLELLGQSLGLAGLTALVALPLGGLLAVLMSRVPIYARQALWAILLLGLFLPMSVTAVAWQVVLGSWLPPLQLAPGAVAWRPWSAGLVPAAWVHAMAALPWVVLLISLLLRYTDRTLEELAQLQGQGQLFRNVLVPRLRLGLLAAALLLFLQTTTEIPITDAMMVRTFAEEVYTQFVSASEGLGRAMLSALPLGVGLIVVTGLGLSRLSQQPLLASAEVQLAPLIPCRASRRLGASLLAWGLVSICLGLPLAALVWKAGGADHRSSFETTRLVGELQKVSKTDGLILVRSLSSALAAGVLTVAMAWLVVAYCWHSRRRTFFLMFLALGLAATPGPILGFGLKELIQLLVQWEGQVLRRLPFGVDFPPLRSLLYDQPSPAPAIWACVLRFFPVAVLFALVSFRTIPQQLWELTQLQGHSSGKQWRLLILPLTGGVAARGVLLITALSLGEISASKLVNPPFYSHFILSLFDQMHYGADSTVAALCLLQLGGSLLLTGLWLLLAQEAEVMRSTN